MADFLTAALNKSFLEYDKRGLDNQWDYTSVGRPETGGIEDRDEGDTFFTLDGEGLFGNDPDTIYKVGGDKIGNYEGHFLDDEGNYYVIVRDGGELFIFSTAPYEKSSAYLSEHVSTVDFNRGEPELEGTDPPPLGGDLDTSLVCFAAGTLIATPAGEVPVETLAVGDMVLTKDHGAKPILWIGSKRVTAAMLARNPKLRPIRIRAGALGKGTPTRDLLVSPQHRILVRSKIARNMFGTIEVLVAARQLLAMGGIDPATDVTEIEYFHFLLNQHEIVVSDGAETESLFTGPEAMKAVGPAARAEILTLFPDLAEQGKVLEAARSLQKGRMGRKLAEQHHLHGRALVG